MKGRHIAPNGHGAAMITRGCSSFEDSMDKIDDRRNVRWGLMSSAKRTEPGLVLGVKLKETPPARNVPDRPSPYVPRAPYIVVS